MVLFMDNSTPWITKVKAQYKEITNHRQANAETMCQIKYEEMQTLAGKHRDNLCCTKRFLR